MTKNRSSFFNNASSNEEEEDNAVSSSSSSSSSDMLRVLLMKEQEDDPTPSSSKKQQDAAAAGKDDDDAITTTTTTSISSPTTVTGLVATETPPPLAISDNNDDADNNNNNNNDTTAVTNNNEAWPVLPASRKSLRTTNPIRAIVDPVLAAAAAKAAAATNNNENNHPGQKQQQQQDRKAHISLALGDPTAHLEPCPVAVTAVVQALAQPHNNNNNNNNDDDSRDCCAGYVNACGTNAARRAIAEHHHSSSPEHVLVASGCSGALELALTALLDGEDSSGNSDDSSSILLVPQPGFPLYQVIAESHGATVAHYRLRGADQDWQVDLDHVQELVLRYGSRRVRGIVVNNPSNPTGAVYSRSHLREIVQFCDAHRVPLVADEVYGDLIVGGGNDGDDDHQLLQFHPLADVADELGRRVPVITASGLGKQYLLPGWRVGWIVFQDNIFGSLQAVEAGAKRLAQVVLGASHLAQAAVPALLDPHNAQVREWKAGLRRQLREQAATLSARLRAIPGLHCGDAQGALYLMIELQPDRLDDAVGCSDVDFCQRLLQEQNVFLLPGRCFGAPSSHSVRAVFCAPVPVLEEAADRIAAFCRDHRRRR